MNKNLKEFLIIASITLTLTSLIFGLCLGLDDDCKYNSIAARVNIPYFLGCEFTRPRFKIPKK